MESYKATLRRFWAFTRRDWQLAFTYRFYFLHRAAQLIFLLISFSFIGRLITDSGANPHLAAYKGDYFQFVLLGLVFSEFMNTALEGFNQMISFEKDQGTLEAILLTPTSFIVLAFSKTLWDLITVAGKAAFCLLVGVFFFQVDLSQANWPAAFLATVLTAGAFLGIGMISAGFSLVWRESMPLGLILGGASRFFAGVYFPISILPEWLRYISYLSPLTYSLESIRNSLLQGFSLFRQANEFRILVGCFILFLSLGLVFFRWALRKARRQGSLALR